MVTLPVQCPHCHSTEVIKAGKQATGAQHYQCQNGQCARRIFSSSIGIGAGHLRSAARSWIWPSMAAGSAIPPACCGSVPRP